MSKKNTIARKFAQAVAQHKRNLDCVIYRGQLWNILDGCIFSVDTAHWLALDCFTLKERENGFEVWGIGSNEDKYIGMIVTGE